VEAEVFWRFRAGTRVVVFYQDDTVWHERYILAPGHRAETYWIVTPDDDVYEEDLQGRSPDGPSRVREVPPGIRTLPNLRTSVYRFREAMTDANLKAKVKVALREHEETYGSIASLADFEVDLPSGGTVGKTHRGTRGLQPSPGERSDLEMSWCLRLGQTSSSEPQMAHSCETAAGFGVSLSQTIRDAWIQERIISLTSVGPLPTAPADILGIPADTTAIEADDQGAILDKEKGKEEGQTGGDNDARTLWVEYDEQGERHREWRKVVADCVVHSWKDWPHEGPPSLQFALKQFGKIGGDPRLWFQLWLRRHHLAETDRTAHEVRTLIEALYLGGVYDQLNLPALAAFEAIGRRLQTITEAYAASPGNAPEWHHARLFTGVSSPDEIVPQELRAWAAKRGKDEVELIQARSKIKEVRKLLASGESTGSAAEDALPGPPGGKGGNRGGRPRKTLEPGIMKTTDGPSPGGRGMGPDARPRGGIFPLPLLQVEARRLGLSRRCAQRQGRRINHIRDANEAIEALNWMAGASVVGDVFRPSCRQQEVLDRVEAACKDALSLPEGVTAPIPQEAAFQELLRGASVYEAAGTTLAPFKLERVSLPDSVHDCPQVADLLPGHARQYLEVPERMMRQDIESVCDVEPYWDPALRSSTKQYKGLIEKLHSIGYLNYTLRPRARAGMFFVKKSDGVRQRLIIDARRANALLAQPPPVRLRTPEAFARFEFNYSSDDLRQAMPGIVGLSSWACPTSKMHFTACDSPGGCRSCSVWIRYRRTGLDCKVRSSMALPLRQTS
ncbi:unnamed protein product, partial [Symbiodinium sp. CCMP2456]